MAEDLGALIAFVEKTYGGQLLELPAGGKAVLLPAMMKLEPVKKLADEWRERPERREGTATLHNLASFCDHANRFKDGDSAIFANAKPPAERAKAIEPPRLVSMLDYHQAGPTGAPRFGRHRGVYVCPFSDSWQAWARVEGERMNQRDFAEFIEDRIGDLMNPPVLSDSEGDANLVETAALLGGQYCPPAMLMELARGIAIKADEKIRQAINLTTGEIEVVYQTEHGEAGERLRVKNLFILAIPVFEDGAVYRLIGRLRYRITGQQLTWHYNLWRADRVFRHAFDELCAEAASKTELPLMRGTAEGAP